MRDAGRSSAVSAVQFAKASRPRDVSAEPSAKVTDASDAQFAKAYAPISVTDAGDGDGGEGSAVEYAAVDAVRRHLRAADVEGRGKGEFALRAAVIANHIPTFARAALPSRSEGVLSRRHKAARGVFFDDIFCILCDAAVFRAAGNKLDRAAVDDLDEVIVARAAVDLRDGRGDGERSEPRSGDAAQDGEGACFRRRSAA